MIRERPYLAQQHGDMLVVRRAAAQGGVGQLGGTFLSRAQRRRRGMLRLQYFEFRSTPVDRLRSANEESQRLFPARPLKAADFNLGKSLVHSTFEHFLRQGIKGALLGFGGRRRGSLCLGNGGSEVRVGRASCPELVEIKTPCLIEITLEEMEKVGEVGGGELETINHGSRHTVVINTHIGKARPHVSPTVQSDAALRQGIVRHAEDQLAVLINPQRRPDRLHRHQIVLILAVHKIVLSQDRVHPFDHAHQTPILALAIHRETVVALGALIAEDDSNGIVVFRCTQVDAEAIVGPV